MQPQIVKKTVPDFAKGQKEDIMLAALTAQPPREIVETVRIPKIARKSAALPSAMRRALPAKESPAIMFASAYGGEGAPGIAFEAARAAATQSFGKVLYIHMSSRLPRFFVDIQYEMPISLDEFLNTSGGTILPFVALDESGLVCAWFRGPGEGVKEESLRILMMSLRKCFDLIILGGDDMLAGGASTAFSELVDGTILVAEAERTRVPVAQRLKRAVEESGGKVIGAILNRRRYHIPGRLYRLLYGGGL
ncbi:MAG: hypothetical protein ACXW30_04150 [Micavibrio sp.]